MNATPRTPGLAPPAPAKKTLVSILVPIYNEDQHIAEVVERVLAAPMPEGVERELVVVNDGSTDETLGELARFADRDDVRLHHLEKNRGKGWAIREGLAIARGEIIVIQDGDTEYDPAELQHLIRPIRDGEARVVYGSRFAGSVEDMYLRYRLVNRLLVWAVRLLYGARITDEATAYKAFHRSVIDSMPLRCVRFEFCPEVTAKVLRLGHAIREVPIHYRARTGAEGKKIRLRDAFEAFWTLLRYRFWAPAVKDDGSSVAMQENLAAVESMGNYLRWIYDTVAPHLGRDVFEAGCGNGNMATLIVRAPGVRSYVGVDHSEALCAQLRRRLATVAGVEWDVQVMPLESPRLREAAPRLFDTIVCLNVLEHIEDDARMLETFRDMLKPGGRLVLLVPAMPSIYGTIDRVVHHFRRYGKRELAAKVARAGLRVGTARYFNILGIAAWVWHGRILKLTVHRSGEMKTWDRLVPLLQAIEKRIPLPAGLSIFLCAEKP
jgi:glycosyltransferase involved in cell wall biosynthesis/precorrin-6B methylase 2